MDLDLLLSSKTSLAFEEELLRSPFQLKIWWQYLQHTKDEGENNNKGQLFLLYERSLRSLPRSYKLWHAYLRERAVFAASFPPLHAENRRLYSVFFVDGAGFGCGDLEDNRTDNNWTPPLLEKFKIAGPNLKLL